MTMNTRQNNPRTHEQQTTTSKLAGNSKKGNPQHQADNESYSTNRNIYYFCHDLPKHYLGCFGPKHYRYIGCASVTLEDASTRLPDVYLEDTTKHAGNNDTTTFHYSSTCSKGLEWSWKIWRWRCGNFEMAEQ